MSDKKPIYFDYAATTPVDPRVAEKMQGYLTMDGCFGNPASNTHGYGLEAKEAVEQAREQVAHLIHCDAQEIVWTSGATEANNLALIGAANFYKKKGKHIITNTIEHKAVLDTCKYLSTQGFDVTFLQPQENGLLDVEAFAAAFQKDTILASVMHVNNEIGVIQDIDAIGNLCRQRGVYFHVDAAQSAGKLAINLQQLPVDLMSLSAHKMYGPKGVGALYVRRKPRVRLMPLIHGGGHELGMRSGTLATQQIVGMGEACALAEQEIKTSEPEILRLRQKLWNGIKSLSGLKLNGDEKLRVAGNLNFSVEGVEGTSLLWALNDIAISTGSACSSATVEPSYILKALGVSDVLAHSSLRLSLGRFTTENDVDYAIKHIRSGIDWLRSLSPKAADV